MNKPDNEEFPFEGFPVKLIHKDGKEVRTAYFQCEAHLEKHLARYKYDKKTIEIKRLGDCPPPKNVAPVGKGTRTEGEPKKRRGRPRSVNS